MLSPSLLAAEPSPKIPVPHLSGNSRAESSAEDTAEDNEEYPVIRINETAFYGGPPANGDLIEDALNEILREKAHAEIEFVYVQMSDLQTQLNLLLTGGDDSLDLLSSFFYAGVSELVSNGQVMAIDDLLASDGQGIQEIFRALCRDPGLRTCRW